MTMTQQRQDVHRPSVINPEDYEFVALGYQRCDTMDDVYSIQINREKLQFHMAMTKGDWSQHAHGGNCHVCGAHCIYTAIFHHQPTNTYIRTGFDCADKLDCHDAQGFRAFKKSIDDARERKAGKNKAEAILSDLGLSQAWEIYNDENDQTFEVGTVQDIVGKLVQYGNISEKQEAFLRKLIDQINNREQIEAERQAEYEAAEPCPTGRIEITGTVLSTRVDETAYGTQIKMLVKDDRGFKVWGSVPSSLQLIEVEIKVADDESYRQQRGLKHGDRIKFTAKVEPSQDDPKFGFYKRPTKAELIEAK